jgi:hypothetical protein
VSDPYGGPPPTSPPSYGAPGYGPPGYGPPAYGPSAYGPPGYGPPPGWGWPPAGYGWAPPGGPWGPPQPPPPRRPGAVTGAAVLSFVQFGFVLLATLYLFLFALLAGSLSGLPDARVPAELSGLVVEGLVLAAVQLAADVLLLVAAIRAMGNRTLVTWRLLVAALGVQVLLAGYWFVRLLVLRSGVPGDASRALTGVTTYAVFFAAVPLVALGLLLFGSGRRWFDPAPAAGGPAPG